MRGPERVLEPLQREEGKQSVAEVRGVPDNAAHPLQTVLVLDSLSGGDWRTGDALVSFHYPLQCHTVMQLVRMLSMVQW